VASAVLKPIRVRNIRTKTLEILAAFYVSVLLAQANPPANSIRYAVDTMLNASGVDAGASGRVQANLKQVGASEHQRLRIQVANLDPETTYTVLAAIGDELNPVVITNFITTARGSARIVYVSGTRPGRSSVKGALSEIVSSVSSIRSISIANTNGEIVLSADLHTAESMTFQLSSVLENAGSDMAAIGCVAVAYQGGGVQFRLFAAGETSQLTFCVNDQPVQTYSTDSAGGIRVGVFPANAPSPLNFRHLSIRNAAGETVLQSAVR
jgi:hypothetical protein